MEHSSPIRLSVLDQAPVPAGSTPSEALANAVELATHVDRLGYHRLWYSEHHAMPLLAGSAPEILIARAGAATERIRVGSGGIMLPHYAAFKVAEQFRTLDALYPGRIDLGLGRAPGGGQLEAQALRRTRAPMGPDDFPQQLAELLAFLHPDQPESAFPADHPFRKVHVAPADEGPAPGVQGAADHGRPEPGTAGLSPDLWLLGSSMWSAATAAANGLPYAFAHFFSSATTRQAIEHYHRNFEPSPWRAQPEATIAIGAICADTQAEADRLHQSVKLLQRRIRQNDRRPVATPEDAARELAATPGAPHPLFGYTQGALDEPDSEFPRYIVGTPESVRDRLLGIARELELGELIVNTIVHSHAARLRSYTLLAEAFGL